MQQLRVALLGQGFMGKAHSNAYCQAPHFYDLPYRCAQADLRPRRLVARLDGGEMGLGGDCHRLARGDRSQGHRRCRHLPAEPPSRARPPLRRRGGQDRPLRKAALAHRSTRRARWPGAARTCRRWCGSTIGGCRPSPTRSSSSRRAAWARSTTTTPRIISSGAPICRARPRGGWIRRWPVQASPTIS